MGHLRWEEECVEVLRAVNGLGAVAVATVQTDRRRQADDDNGHGNDDDERRCETPTMQQSASDEATIRHPR